MTNAAISSLGDFRSSPKLPHPDIDRWIAYRTGELADVEAENLQDHLAECRECTALLLDLEKFADPQPRDTASTEFERSAVWRTLEARLPTRLRRPRWKRAAPAVIAASFVALVLGSGLWLQGRQLSALRLQTDELARPQANVPIHDLYPRSATRGGVAPEGALPRPQAATMTLVLNSLEPQPGARFRARILDAEEREQLVVDGLETDEMGVITFSLTRDALAPGRYVVRLDKAGETGWDSHEDFALELRDPSH